MAIETSQPEKGDKRSCILTLIGVAGIGFACGFIVVREYLLQKYPEIYSMVCSTSIALTGVGVALKAAKPISNAIKESRERRIAYEEAYPERTKEAIKASKKIRKEETATYRAKLRILKIALALAIKSGDKKLIGQYTKLAADMKRQFKLIK